MKILVTGGAGFVGSHLCQKLLAQENEVICLDNFQTSSKENIQKLLTNPKFTFVLHDVTVPLEIKVDQIYNLACPASPIHYQLEPVKTVKTSVLGAINMLELAKNNQAQILQASTSEVYGDPHIHPQTETYWGNVNCLGLRACYDEGKRCAETLFFDYHRQFKVAIRVIRIFNTYGPQMAENDGRVVSNFIIQALKNEPLTIFGQGNQTRSFQYIDDLIAGMTKMMNNDQDFIGPVNLGNPTEFTIKELAELVLKLIPQSASQIVYQPLPEDDPRQRRPDIALAQKKLNWAPQIKLEDGLKATIEYFKNKLKNINP
ncbi:MAG TPA: SDR family oxidoreductase [bacterium]|nr:SDR family oxidoreductase [bacterium]HNS33760.1 SDR family oxidoreductase [bacterium]